MNDESEVLLRALVEGDEVKRIEAVQALCHLETSSTRIVRALDRTVISDPSVLVQVLALDALAMPVHQLYHRQLFHIDRQSRQIILPLIDQWSLEGLLTPEVTALLKRRYTLGPSASLPKVEPIKARAPVVPQEVVVKPETKPIKHKPIVLDDSVVETDSADTEVEQPIILDDGEIETTVVEIEVKQPTVLDDGEIETDSADIELEQSILEKQKFSLIETLLSEVTINIALYLGAFLIVAAAIIFAGLVEPARFPMLSLTIVGFLTGARFTLERLPRGSFVLFVIGTLLIPIDAAVFTAFIDFDASQVYWAAVMVVMSIVWGWGTYFYQSRFLSVTLFATFSVAVYLFANMYVPLMSSEFLLVVSLVALAGLGEAVFLERWKGDDFFEPMFIVAHLQALGVLGVLGITLLDRVTILIAWIGNIGSLSDFDSQEATLLGAWLTLATLYFCSDLLSRRWKKTWYVPAFQILVVVCLLTPPVFIIEAMSANTHEIAAVLWGWGVLVLVVAEALQISTTPWGQFYKLLFLSTSSLFLAAAPLVEYVTTTEYAVGYLLANSLVYFFLTYRRKQIWTWVVALIAAYLAYLIGVNIVRVDASPVFVGFALLIPALTFLSLELAGRRYFRVPPEWTIPPLLLGIVNAVWDVSILLSWYDDYPHSAAVIFLIFGAFGALYAVWDDQREENRAIIAWIGGVIATYAAYINLVPNVNKLDFGGYVLLAPVLVCFSADLIGHHYLQVGQFWRGPLIWMGLFNATLGVLLTAFGGLTGHPGSAVIIFIIYGLISLLYAAFNEQSDNNNAPITWTVTLLLLYAAYWFIYLIPSIKRLDINAGFAILIPILVFLSAELVGKFYFQVSRAWTFPLFGLGVFNALLLIPSMVNSGLQDGPGGAVIICLLTGLFGMVYARFHVETERKYGIAAWTVSLITLYVGYGFIYRLPAVDGLNINIGFAILLPALVFLSAELAGKFYFQVSRAWTLPLLGLGIFNALLVVPVAFIGGLNDMPGSAAVIFLLYGLFGLLYGVLHARVEIGHLATGSIVLAIFFARLYYDHDRWVLPFAALAVIYYLSGVATGYFYDWSSWSKMFHRNGLALGTVAALSAPIQGGGDAVVGMGAIATLYGGEAFRNRNVWYGLPANGLFLGAYVMALQELNVTEPQYYSTGIALMAILSHYLVYRRTEDQQDFGIAFATGVLAQLILLGTSFIQMSGGLQFFFILFFQSLILLGYGLVTRSLSFVVVPILFVVVGVIRVVFTVLAGYSTVVTLGCTGLVLVILGITALIMRERIIETYDEISQGYIADEY